MSKDIVVTTTKNEKANFARIPQERLAEDKKFILCLRRGPNCPLSFAENLVFSLITRLPSSQREIAKLTGLDRKKTVPDALTGLQQLGLAELSGTSWIAREPAHKNWFLEIPEPVSNNWWERLIYFKVFILADDLPANLLTARQNVLFSRILNFPGKLPSWYADGLGLPRRTVQALLHGMKDYKGLVALGLIRQDDHGGCYVQHTLPDHWQDKIKAKTIFANSIKTFLKSIDGEEIHLQWGQAPKIIETQSARILDHGWHNKTWLRNYWVDCFNGLAPGTADHQHRVETFLAEFPKMLDYVFATAKTAAYLKSTTDLMVKQIANRHAKALLYYHFDPATLLK